MNMDNDKVLEYKCKSCGKLTTEYRRIRITGKIRNTEYDIYKCPYCRGSLEKIDSNLIFKG